MALLLPNFEKNAKKLIKQITGFRSGDENFQICLNFVLSNFKYHRFLEVDSHKVRRNLDGLRVKFQVYSQLEKADQFEELIQKFLSTPAFTDDKPKSDTHYALLHVLLSLAEKPTQFNYVPSTHEDVKDEEEAFDWKAYLLEGEDIVYRPSYSYSDTSDEDEEDGDLAEESGSATIVPSDSGVQVDTVTTDHDDIIPVIPDRPVTGGQYSMIAHRDWLSRNVVMQYWKPETIADGTCQRSTGIADVWEHYLSGMNPLHVKEEYQQLTETQIIRETIWMLFGACSSVSFLYTFKDEVFNISEKVKLSHLTPKALISVLESFCYYGNIVYKLESFVEKTTELSLNPMADDNTADSGTCRADGTTCQSYQAFATAISSYLKSYKSSLVILEEDIIKQDTNITVAILMNKLHESFEELTFISEVFDECLAPPCDEEGRASPSGGERSDMRRNAYLLITKLHQVLSTVNVYKQDSVRKFKLILPIWLQTIRPYLDIIGQWLTSGRLVDVYNEFIINRNADVNSDDPEFWQKSFILHCSVVDDDDATHLSFLEPVIRELLLSGKSMEVLNTLGKLNKVIPLKEQRIPLYEIFVKNLQNQLKSSDQSESLSLLPKRCGKHGNQMIVAADDSNYDALLHINFADLLNVKEFICDDYNEKENKLQQKINNLEMDGCKQFHQLVHRSLFPYIHERYLVISRQLLAVLYEEYDFQKHLQTLKAFYLMGAGDTMYDFYTVLFEKLRHRESWNDVALLNGLLEDAIYTHFPEQKSEMFLDVVELPPSPKSQLPINALNGLQLHYKLPWAVSLVVNSNCQEIYSQIFTLLLQIKRAKYSLDILSFNDLSRSNGGEKLSVDETFLSLYVTEDSYHAGVKHRMLLLRQKLLHFVNSFHNYIMTRILHSSGLEFEDKLSRCEDFDQVIETHWIYITRLQEQCLLTKPLGVLKEAVCRVFNLALRFSSLWDEGYMSVNMVDLIDIETHLSRCISFLSVFLNNIIKRGSTPHLETLAFYLSTQS